MYDTWFYTCCKEENGHATLYPICDASVADPVYRIREGILARIVIR